MLLYNFVCVLIYIFNCFIWLSPPLICNSSVKEYIYIFILKYKCIENGKEARKGLKKQSEAWMNWRKVIKGVGGGPWWEVASLIMATFLGFHWKKLGNRFVETPGWWLGFWFYKHQQGRLATTLHGLKSLLGLKCRWLW